MRLPLADLAVLIERALCAAGLAADSAPVVAAGMVAAERDGARSHGLLRLPGYVAALRSGWASGDARPTVVEDAPGLLVVDAANGFAQVALAGSRAVLAGKARTNGVATLLIRDSHHFGALWPDIEDFCAEGFIALTCTNSKQRMAAWGGQKRVFGTNAMAFGCPRLDAQPLIWDQASSVMSQGEVLLAATRGTELPDGVGLDATGAPTRSASAILEGGVLLPFGHHKGAALAFTVEVLAAALTGSYFGFEDKSDGVAGSTTSQAGQFIMLIDPARAGRTDVAARISLLCNQLRVSGSTRLPGDSRYRRRSCSVAKGVEFSDADIALLHRLAKGIHAAEQESD